MIPVVWHAQADGRGYYNSTALLNDMLDLYPCEHYGGLNGIPEKISGAVIVVHGGRELDAIERLNTDIRSLGWVILVVLGDEENSFPVEKIEHSNKRIWIQEPLPGRHDFCNRFMVNGYGHDFRKYIVRCEKDLTWFFGGQHTNSRRHACVDALSTMEWGGITILSKGYHQGISLGEYYRTLCRAKIVPCPSGPFSQDAARPWDALEAGCLPILDDLSPARMTPGFWKYLLGEAHPFPVITEWSTLPSLIGELEKDWEEQFVMCRAWWEAYKARFSSWLETDIWKLTGVSCTKI